MTPDEEHGPITPLRCAACDADVLRDDYADVMFWQAPDRTWALAHTVCLEPFEAAERAALEHQ